MANKRSIGSKYEKIAADYFIQKGYTILEQNYHAGKYGEIDLILKDRQGTLVICECKYRTKNAWGDPLEAVDYRKQKQISKTTLFYYRQKGYGVDHPCRFDVIAIYGDGKIVHVENAFDFSFF
jgi:putative endonuclease